MVYKNIKFVQKQTSKIQKKRPTPQTFRLKTNTFKLPAQKNIQFPRIDDRIWMLRPEGDVNEPPHQPPTPQRVEVAPDLNWIRSKAKQNGPPEKDKQESTSRNYQMLHTQRDSECVYANQVSEGERPRWPLGAFSSTLLTFNEPAARGQH